MYIVDDFVVKDDQVMSKKGLETIDLGFSDIRLELKTKKSNNGGRKVLLDGSIRGRARPGRMLAIMGPSGAGKVSNPPTHIHTLSLLGFQDNAEALQIAEKI